MHRLLFGSLLILGLTLGLAAAGNNCQAEGEAPPAPGKPEPFDPIKQKIADDWDRLQGVWEHRRTVNGQQLRMVKTIKDHSEVLRGFDAAGKLVREQTADLKIEIRGNLHVLSWSNAKVTAGAGTGTTIPDGTAVFTFKESRWICVSGLAENEQWAVYAENWARPIDETAP